MTTARRESAKWQTELDQLNEYLRNRQLTHPATIALLAHATGVLIGSTTDTEDEQQQVILDVIETICRAIDEYKHPALPKSSTVH